MVQEMGDGKTGLPDLVRTANSQAACNDFFRQYLQSAPAVKIRANHVYIYDRTYFSWMCDFCITNNIRMFSYTGDDKEKMRDIQGRPTKSESFGVDIYT
ncbi:MAG: hypothetical protein IPF54_17970 [Draconibacterium sp.]|nr:hypothetical protein [Draconibacterium sp.]